MGRRNRVFEKLVIVCIASLFASFHQAEASEKFVQCYVCSWQRPTENFTMTDTCTHYNFHAEHSVIVNCSGGCEAVTTRHTMNGEVIHFRRNCVNKWRGSKSEVRSDFTDVCHGVDGKGEYLNVCECHSDLCNSSERTTSANFCYLGVLTSLLYVFTG